MHLLPVSPSPGRPTEWSMNMNDLGRGYIQLYTGDGKGKTTASLGLALRAVGRGLRVLVIQFLKGDELPSGEEIAVKDLAPNLEIRRRGAPGFIEEGRVSGKDRELAGAALEEAGREMETGSWDVIILDEINVAVHFDLIPLQDVLSLLDRKPEGLEMVLTGRRAPQELIDRADLVTEMREVKHYYHSGVPARRGIEK